MSDYAKGFKDGFAAGLEEGKKLAQSPYDISKWKQDPLPPLPPQIGWPSTQPIFAADKCPKCGISIGGVMGYVCHSPNCPTFPQVTCGSGPAMTAAVTGRSDYTPGYNEGVGANGPAGGLENGYAYR